MNGDFEVHPIGTTIEVREMRKFANDLIKLAEVQPLSEEILRKIQEMRVFYEDHVERFPVKV